MTVTANSGVAHNSPSGFATSNFDPNLNSQYTNQYYDANFIPGFKVGLTDTSIYWNSGSGYADIGYSIGPWSYDERGIPHLAVGPQCCNFVEVNHTQQFRQPSWGDYYYVRAGFGAPGVNVDNYTADFKSAADVGLRTDWNWTVQVSLKWQPPTLLNQSNEWAAIGIATTQYVSNVPGNLIYSVVDFWMDGNSSRAMALSGLGIPEAVIGPNVVVYHPSQLAQEGNATITFNLSPYLKDTLRELGIKPSQSPVISYVYLNIEGYNFAWNGTLWSFRVMTPNASGSTGAPIPAAELAGGLAIACVSVVLIYYYGVRHRADPEASGGD